MEFLCVNEFLLDWPEPPLGYHEWNVKQRSQNRYLAQAHASRGDVGENLWLAIDIEMIGVCPELGH